MACVVEVLVKQPEMVLFKINHKSLIYISLQLIKLTFMSPQVNHTCNQNYSIRTNLVGIKFGETARKKHDSIYAHVTLSW